jgi:peptidoglycan/LPS O-acetylase OafA/YrhL
MNFSASSWALLGLVRFFLALIVFTTHLQWVTDLKFPFLQIYELDGLSAVFGFFLISGFSVAHSYAKRPSGYYVRRFLRIYPLYFVAVVFAHSLTVLLGNRVVLANWVIQATGWKTSVANIVMLQGFAATAITYNLPLWSLSFEVCYYLVLPFLFRTKPLVALGFVAVSMTLFLFPKTFLLGYGALKYAWPWLLGFLLVKDKGNPWIAILSTGGCALIYFTQHESWGVFAFAMTLAALLLAPRIHLPPKLQSIFNYLGEISYPLYLFHSPLLILFYVKFGVRDVYVFTILVLLSTAGIDWFFDKKLKALFWEPLSRKIFRLKD